MRVVRLRVSELVQARTSLELAVVIDVLRASSTAAALLCRVPEIAAVAQPDDLAQLPSRPWLIVSELSRAAEVARGAPRIDNSPVLASTVPLDGRTPLLVTTNGTRALTAAAARAERVLVASFLNLAATVEEIARHAPNEVTLVPAGDVERDQPHAEDERCADAIAALVAGDGPDLPSLLASARGDARIERRLAREPGLAGDLDLVFSPDARPVAAAFHASGPAAGFIRRCA